MPTLLQIGLSNVLVASALAVVAFACSRCRRPALAHGLWLLVLLKLVTPALIPVRVPWFDRGVASSPAGASLSTRQSRPSASAGSEQLTSNQLAWTESVPTDPFPPLADGEADIQAEAADLPALTAAENEPASVPETPPTSWWTVAAWTWLAGSCLWFAGVVLSIHRSRRLLRSARPASAPVQSQAGELARRLGLKRCPRVWLVPGAVSPMVWALGGAPRLLFPSKLLDRLDADQRAALLLHELAHVRRRDHWVRLVELIALGLYWWCPVAWWARRELREAEEQCCDAWVVWASAGAGHDYALALLQTVAFVSNARLPLPMGASGIGHVPQLRRRLTMIMQGRTPRSLSVVGWAGLLGLGLFLLPLMPARAQDKSDPFKKVVLGDDKQDPRDQKIEQLKKAIKELEDQKAAEKKKGPDKGANFKPAPETAPEVQKLLAAAADLKKQIGAKRQELEDLEVKMKQILRALKQYNIYSTPEHEKNGKLPKDPTDKGYKKPADKKGYDKYELEKKIYDKSGDKKAFTDKKSMDLEMKVNMLMKEVELLRQEIRKLNPKLDSPKR
jgi:beta-lactamase regulating signal transducer with metallopeptidase domain